MKYRCFVEGSLSYKITCIVGDVMYNVPVIQVKKVKESRNRLGVAQRIPGGLSSQIFMTFGT